jgi:hypothetical protein
VGCELIQLYRIVWANEGTSEQRDSKSGFNSGIMMGGKSGILRKAVTERDATDFYDRWIHLSTIDHHSSCRATTFHSYIILPSYPTLPEQHS